MNDGVSVWERVYELADKVDPSYTLVSAPAWTDSSKPLMVIVHPGDVTRLDLRKEYDEDFVERDSQYLFQGGMGDEIQQWLNHEWDVVVLHGRTSAGFLRREDEAQWAYPAVGGLHDNIAAMAMFDAALEGVHRRCGVMYGEEFGAVAQELLDASKYKAAGRPAVVLTGSYSDLARPISKLGQILEEAGVTVYTSVNLPTTLKDVEEWEAKAGSFNYQVEQEIGKSLEHGSLRP